MLVRLIIHGANPTQKKLSLLSANFINKLGMNSKTMLETSCMLILPHYYCNMEEVKH